MTVHIVDPRHIPHFCHQGHFVHGLIGQRQGWLAKKKRMTIHRIAQSIYLLDYWKPLLLKLSFDEHLYGTQVSVGSSRGGLQKSVSTLSFYFWGHPLHRSLANHLAAEAAEASVWMALLSPCWAPCLKNRSAPWRRWPCWLVFCQLGTN